MPEIDSSQNASAIPHTRQRERTFTLALYTPAFAASGQYTWQIDSQFDGNVSAMYPPRLSLHPVLLRTSLLAVSHSWVTLAGFIEISHLWPPWAREGAMSTSSRPSAASSFSYTTSALAAIITDQSDISVPPDSLQPKRTTGGIAPSGILSSTSKTYPLKPAACARSSITSVRCNRRRHYLRDGGQRSSVLSRGAGWRTRTMRG